MYVLHTEPESGGFAVHAALEAAGAEYRLVEVEGKSARQRTPEFLKLSPLGQVPVVELPDGTVMTESAAIVIHIADTLAPGKLAPDAASPDRPAFLRWLVFMAVNVYGANLRLYYPQRYSTDEAGAQAVKEAALAHMDAQFAIIEEAIGDHAFLISDSFSAADPYLLMLAHWHPDPGALFARHPNLARLCDATRELAPVKAANTFHRIW
ncbi:MAG TPA: glutathione S-transferase family protein [Hyphomicrobiales bacterium]|nr:glutathione S-transferase family protein [Hyphomicrobiales bacterium]